MQHYDNCNNIDIKVDIRKIDFIYDALKKLALDSCCFEHQAEDFDKKILLYFEIEDLVKVTEEQVKNLNINQLGHLDLIELKKIDDKCPLYTYAINHEDLLLFLSFEQIKQLTMDDAKKVRENQYLCLDLKN